MRNAHRVPYLAPAVLVKVEVVALARVVGIDVLAAVVCGRNRVLKPPIRVGYRTSHDRRADRRSVARKAAIAVGGGCQSRRGQQQLFGRIRHEQLLRTNLLQTKQLPRLQATRAAFADQTPEKPRETLAGEDVHPPFYKHMAYGGLNAGTPRAFG